MDYFTRMCDMTGYHPITTFWDDFTIADTFGTEGIIDTYRRAFKAWKNDYKFFTELVMVLNWKSWYHYDLGHSDISQLYADLFYKAQEYGYEHLKDEELTYFWSTLD